MMVFKPVGNRVGVLVWCFFFFKRENAVECVCKNYVNDEPKISMRVGSFLWPTGQMYKTIKPN